MKKIGVFDSGIGGLNILEKLKELMPNEEFIYYKDTKNCPYGSKSDEELLTITANIVENLINQGAYIIVIACNTATTKCISKLREIYPEIIFIGTEPAIKTACEKNYKNILVLGTPNTIKSKSVNNLIKNNKQDFQNIYLVPCEGLANAIENKNDKQIKELLNKYLKQYKDKNIDAVVLGCTHYNFIKNEIKRELPNVTFIDGSLGVAKQVQRYLDYK